VDLIRGAKIAVASNSGSIIIYEKSYGEYNKNNKVIDNK
jgi:hypothetical protein